MSFNSLLSHFDESELKQIRTGNYVDFDDCWKLLERVTNTTERDLAEHQLFTIPTVEYRVMRRGIRKPVFIVRFYPDSIMLVCNQKYGCFDVKRLLEDTSGTLHECSEMKELDNGLLQLYSCYAGSDIIHSHELSIVIDMNRDQVRALYERTNRYKEVICDRVIGRYWLDYNEAVKKYDLDYKPTFHEDAPFGKTLKRRHIRL